MTRNSVFEGLTERKLDDIEIQIQIRYMIRKVKFLSKMTPRLRAESTGERMTSLGE